MTRQEETQPPGRVLEYCTIGNGSTVYSGKSLREHNSFFAKMGAEDIVNDPHGVLGVHLALLHQSPAKKKRGHFGIRFSHCCKRKLLIHVGVVQKFIRFEMKGFTHA